MQFCYMQPYLITPYSSITSVAIMNANLDQSGVASTLECHGVSLKISIIYMYIHTQHICMYVRIYIVKDICDKYPHINMNRYDI